MNREHLKSITLFSLVLLSIILTTRIWFDISIEGIFVMSEKNSGATGQQNSFDLSSLLSPERMYVNFGGPNNSKQVMSISNTESKEGSLYDRTFEASKTLLRSVLAERTTPLVKTDMKRWEDLKLNRSIELKMSSSLKLDEFAAVLGVDKLQWHDIQSVDAINISPDNKKLYIMDEKKPSFYEFNIGDQGKELSLLLKEAEGDSKDVMPLVIFSDFNPLMYEKGMTVPIPDTMPVLQAEETPDIGDTIPPMVANFFNKGETLSGLKDADGTMSYTDREIWVRVDNNGTLEYFKANIRPDENAATDLRKALEISADFISKHMGFPQGTYITDIQKKDIDGTKSVEYTFKYRYRYKNIPIIMKKDDAGSSTIEISIYGGEVRHYKRHTISIKSEGEVKQIMNPVNILDSMFNIAGVIKFQDMYLAYRESEKNGQLYFTPVWVVTAYISDGQDKDNEKGQLKPFFIPAYYSDTSWTNTNP